MTKSGVMRSAGAGKLAMSLIRGCSKRTPGQTRAITSEITGSSTLSMRQTSRTRQAFRGVLGIPAGTNQIVPLAPSTRPRRCALRQASVATDEIRNTITSKNHRAGLAGSTRLYIRSCQDQFRSQIPTSVRSSLVSNEAILTDRSRERRTIHKPQLRHRWNHD